MILREESSLRERRLIQMSINPDILPLVATELQKAKDPQEATEVWHRFLPFLDDCRLIYSHPEETDIGMPSKTWPRNFPKGGFLRPLFANDYMYFMNQRIAEERWLGLASRI